MFAYSDNPRITPLKECHYRGMEKECTIEGCSRPLLCKGVCKAHYNKQWQAAHPTYAREKYLENRTLLTDEERTARMLEGSRKGGAIGGAMSKQRSLERGPLTTAVSYKGAHARVHRWRGRASEHQCIQCGNQASEWAYCNGSPNEMSGYIEVERRKKQQDGTRLKLAHWSPIITDYDPMCADCHRIKDQAFYGAPLF